jgi:hypothetical protein
MRIIFFISFLFSSSLAAQIDQGTWMAGGRASSELQDNNASGQKYRSISLSPDGFYFLSRNFGVGGRLDYRFDRLVSSTLGDRIWYNQHLLDVQPAIRFYYFNPAADPLKAFLQLQGRYGIRSNNSNIAVEPPLTLENRGVSAGAGLDYFIRESTALEAFFSYRYDERELPIANMPNSIGLLSSQLWSLGIDLRFFLPQAGEDTSPAYPMLFFRTWMVDGRALLEGGTNDVFRLTLQPRLGYFFMDRLVLGSGFFIEVSNDQDAKENAWEVEPFGRYYFYLSDYWQFFPQVSFGFRRTATVSGAADESILRVRNYKVGGGLSAFLTSEAAFEIVLSYSLQDFSRDDFPFIPGNRNNIITIDAGLKYFFGERRD